MKNWIIRSAIALALFAGLTHNAPALELATFTNTPAATSNTYSGFITLQIGGLTNLETVLVQKYIDANANGVIDAGDPLVQQFTLTDGTNFVIGGVTNFNVPGDMNSATGAITTKMSFNNGDFMQNLAATYLYKLSSPAGNFTPKTNTFTVTNFPFAQKFAGNVVSNNNIFITLPYAFVILFPAPRPGHNGPGQPLGGTVANSFGAYTIAAPAGTYSLVPFYTNYVSSFNKAPVLTLSNGITITTNLSVNIATTIISGTIVDAANPSIVLPGVFMPLTSTNGLVTSAFSDANGNYTARVTTNQWSLGTDDSGLIIHGYVGSQNGTNVNSPATGVTLGFARANALFYGVITNSQGIPLAGIDVNDEDSVSNLYSMDGYTDPNGNYWLGAVGTGNTDPWQLGISSESLATLTNVIISLSQPSQTGGTNLTPGLAVPQNFTVTPATNFISGNLKDSSNNVIANVQVFAYASLGGVDYQSEANTDTNGNFSVNVTTGTWYLNVFCGGGQNSLTNTYLCPSTVVLNISNNNVTTNFVVQFCNGIAITTAPTLPVGEVNVPYYQPFSASSCNPSFNWTNTSGNSALPPGLSFYSNGQLSGTPTTNGVFLFTAKVTDGNNASTNQQFSLTINTAVQVTTTSLPAGTNGLNYSQQLAASGGQIFGGASPYSWSFTPGPNSLPASLNLATNGLISGTAATNGTFSFSVRVTDRVGSFADQYLSLTLNATNTATPPPAVGIAQAGGQLLLYYPLSGTNYVLQTATNLAGPWVTASNGVQAISFLFTNNAPVQFYRLH